MTDQCSDCAHARVETVKVDDGPGYIDEYCDMEDSMTDRDCELRDEDRCPYYEKGEDDIEIPEESAGNLPKIGTFEWVLARVRHGAEYQQFRRRGWAKRWPDAVLDMSEADRRQASEIYAGSLSDVETIVVTCHCGYCMMISVWSIGFPDEGWVDEFKAKANRRMGE